MILSDHRKNVDFKSFVVWLKRMSDYVFQPSSVQSRQFQTLAPLTIMPSQHMNAVDKIKYYSSFKKKLIVLGQYLDTPNCDLRHKGADKRAKDIRSQ